MPFTVTWTVGAASYSRSSNAANAKVKAILQRSAIYAGINTNGMTDEQIVLALIDADLGRHKAQSQHVQRQQLEEANAAAIETTVAGDNTM